MDEYKISVIIPVYNAEKYLKRSIDSIINQSIGFKNIELILVDDNSNDNSREVIEDYSKKYSNIRPIYLEKNSGYPGRPRNIGMRNASADYIMFMDNDDEYQAEMCEKLYNTLIDNNADVVSCNYQNIDSIHVSDMKFEYYGDITVIDDKIICGSKTAPIFDNILIWNKIFKKSIIDSNNITFYEDRISDDFLFCSEYLLNVDKLVYLKDFFGYKRYLQDDSLSIKTDLNKIKSSINTCYNVFNLFKSYGFDFEGCKYSDYIFKKHIRYSIEHLSTLSNKNDIKEGLNELYTFEKAISFSTSLNNIFLTIINKLILKKQWNLVIFLFDLMKLFINSTTLRKVYRILSK